MSVIIETSIGDIIVDLYTDERPKCCMNFLKLCKIKYYNFSLFHTVQKNLVAQTGDPTATGRGGESVFVELYGEQARFFEMELLPHIKHTRKGLISMVNNGIGMHGSQFFFTLADNLNYLDGKHTVFGEVAEGLDTLDKLNNAFCGEDYRPHQDIRIYHTIILDDPYDDPDGLEILVVSPGPTEEMLNSDHIPCNADIDEDKSRTEEELTEMMAEKEAKANAQILEMVGDLPNADAPPPENVLFICKLNPVTTSEDLEIIFSRFGPVVSCEVIKDSKTRESLQYAFIEFENPEHCENAYFKMDNVLIDDRRIHVDFSQSVSKLKWKGRGRVIEIQPQGDAPVYVLKNQQRQNDDYDLIYEHGDKKGPSEDRVSEKSSTGRGSRNSVKHKDQKKRWKRGRSRSPVQSGKNKNTQSGSLSKHALRNKDKKEDELKLECEMREIFFQSRQEKSQYKYRGENSEHERRKRKKTSREEKGGGKFRDTL